MLTNERITEIKARCAKEDLDWYIEDILALIKALEESKELIARYTALKQAVQGDCDYCIYVDVHDETCDECLKNNARINWRLNTDNLESF